MKKVIASAGVLALGAVAAQNVCAQLDSAIERPWSISGTLRGFYDDNYNTQPNGPAKLSSYGIEARPQISFAHTEGPTSLNASYTYDERYFFSRPGNKSDQSHDFELSLLHNFNERYSVDFLESFVSSQEPEVIDTALSFPLRANGNNLRNAAAINVTGQVTPLIGFVTGYSMTWYDYTGQNPVPNTPSYAAELNRFEHIVTLNSTWRLREDTTGILGYQFGAVDYTSSETLNPGGAYVPPSDRNNFTQKIYVGANEALRSDLTVSLQVGVEYANYYNELPGANTSPLNPYVSLSSTYTYMDGGSLTVGFNHSLNQTDVGYDRATGTLTANQESSSLYGTVQQTITPISPKLIARLSAQYQNSRFNGGGFNNERDVFYLLGLNFTYQFTHFISAEIGYNYDLLQSDIPDRGYDRNRAYIGVTATY